MTIETTKIYAKNLAAFVGGKRLIINEGGTSCFSGKQLVVTTRGSIPISKIVCGDIVKTFNESSKKVEWKPVKNLFKYKNTKPTIKINLKNGKTITVTDDHKFYFKGGWISIKDILYLTHGRYVEKNSEI